MYDLELNSDNVFFLFKMKIYTINKYRIVYKSMKIAKDSQF